MNIFRVAFIGSLLLLALGCGSLGDTHIAGEQISITVGDSVLHDARKMKRLRRYRTVETLHEHVSYRFNRLKVRQSLKLNITITKFLVGWETDQMGIEVVVMDDDKELARFNQIETSRKHSPVVHMSKRFARRIYKRIRELEDS